MISFQAPISISLDSLWSFIKGFYVKKVHARACHACTGLWSAYSSQRGQRVPGGKIHSTYLSLLCSVVPSSKKSLACNTPCYFSWFWLPLQQVPRQLQAGNGHMVTKCQNGYKIFKMPRHPINLISLRSLRNWIYHCRNRFQQRVNLKVGARAGVMRYLSKWYSDILHNIKGGKLCHKVFRILNIEL